MSGDGCEAEAFGEVEHHLPGGVALVGYLAVEDGVLDGVLDGAYLAAGAYAEGGHDVFAAHRGLEVAYAVALLEFDELALHQLEVGGAASPRCVW